MILEVQVTSHENGHLVDNVKEAFSHDVCTNTVNSQDVILAYLFLLMFSGLRVASVVGLCVGSTDCTMKVLLMPVNICDLFF